MFQKKLKIVSALAVLLVVPIMVVAQVQLSKIKGLNVKNVTINSAKISWSKSNQAKYYQLRLQNRNSETIKTWKELSKNSKNISASMRLLSQGKKYQVKVRACVKNDCSKWSAIKSFTTLIDADDDGVDSTLDCNDEDQNTSSNITYYMDADGDGLGDAISSTVLCSITAPTGYVANVNDTNDDDYDNDSYTTSTDCNDLDATVYTTYYADVDQDGLGNPNSTSCAGSSAPTGYVTNSVDCNDADQNASSNVTYYTDADGDGLGDASSSTILCSTTPPAGYVANANDTNDDDYDNDSHVTASDCNDLDATTYTIYYADVDQDGLGNPNSTSCAGSSAPTGYATNSTDLDDNDYFNGNYPVCSSDTYNCSDFSTEFRAQKYYDYCVAQGAGDIHNLDGDADGEACESLD